MRKPIIAGNWKLNKTISEASSLASEIKNSIKECDIEVVVCPVFTGLCAVKGVLEDSFIQLGAQDVYWQDSGAFTGEVSALMLKDAGCDYTIIGHSERRQYFNEINKSVNEKVKASIKASLKVMMCVGERLEEREAGNTFDVVKKHVVEGLKEISGEDTKSLVIAYEPVWAIGTGKTATPQQAQEVHKFIRGLLLEIYGQKIADEIRIQYGGSVKPDNIKELISCPDIDGALVGGASLKASSFSQLVNISNQVYKELVKG